MIPQFDSGHLCGFRIPINRNIHRFMFLYQFIREFIPEIRDLEKSVKFRWKLGDTSSRKTCDALFHSPFDNVVRTIFLIYSKKISWIDHHEIFQIYRYDKKKFAIFRSILDFYKSQEYSWKILENSKKILTWCLLAWVMWLHVSHQGVHS